MSSKIDEYIAKHDGWTEELVALRNLFLSTEMEESIKWGAPIYTVNGKNVTGMAAFKNHYGIWFFNGVFLKDKHNLLISAQETTKALRQIKFQKGDPVNFDHVREYVLEAIENEKKGMKIKPQRTTTYEMPDLLKSALDNTPEFLDAFKSLSMGKQKDYANYITEAKQEKTKLTRLDKIKPMILEGKGLHDKYVR